MGEFEHRYWGLQIDRIAIGRLRAEEIGETIDQVRAAMMALCAAGDPTQCVPGKRQ